MTRKMAKYKTNCLHLTVSGDILKPYLLILEKKRLTKLDFSVPQRGDTQESNHWPPI